MFLQRVTKYSASNIYWLVCTSLILMLSIFGRNIQKWLFSYINHTWITPGILALSFFSLILLYRQRSQLSINPVPLFFAGFFLLLGALAVYMDYLRPIELTHFLLFSLLGWLSAKAFGLFWGCLAMLGVATGDEVLQYFLPDRVGDLHDIIINSLSGFLGAWMCNNDL